MAHRKFFKTPQELRKWFEKYHEEEEELFLCYYKTSSGKPSVTWPQSVDEALCFGWIDGHRRSIDEISYVIRFTPRKKNSTWSVVNTKRFAELEKEGKIHPKGKKVFSERNVSKAKLYSFEQKEKKPDPAVVKAIKKNAAAWRYFSAQAPSYQYTVSWWVTSAKKEETRVKRLATLISDCEKGVRISQMRWNKK